MGITRQSIITAAIELFSHRGVSVASVDIAKKAGISNGSLFNYFATKQALIDATYTYIKCERKAFIFDKLDTHLPVRDTVFTLWLRLVHWNLQNSDMQRVVDMLHCSQKLTSWVLNESEPICTTVSNFLHAKFEDQIIKSVSVDLLSRLLCAQVETIADFIRMKQAPKQSSEAILTQGFDIFWDGISK